jgi:hypothetical protein
LKIISKKQHQDYLNGKHTNISTPVSSLHCIIAAFELLETLGDSLKIDLRDFYCALFTQIGRINTRPGFADYRISMRSRSRNAIELLLSGLDTMLKKNRQVLLFNLRFPLNV